MFWLLSTHSTFNLSVLFISLNNSATVNFIHLNQKWAFLVIRLQCNEIVEFMSSRNYKFNHQYRFLKAIILFILQLLFLYTLHYIHSLFDDSQSEILAGVSSQSFLIRDTINDFLKYFYIPLEKLRDLTERCPLNNSAN